MCEPNVTLEQLNDPELFERIDNPITYNFAVGDILYFASIFQEYQDENNETHSEFSVIDCRPVIEVTPEYIKTRSRLDNIILKRFRRNLIASEKRKGQPIKQLFKKIGNYETRKEFIKLLEGTPNSFRDEGALNYFKKPFNDREISAYLSEKPKGGYKKKQKHTIKRTINKKNKKNKRRQTQRKR